MTMKRKFATLLGLQAFDDDSDSSSDDHHTEMRGASIAWSLKPSKQKRHRQQGYIQDVVSGFRLDEFKTFVRVSRITVQNLQDKISEICNEKLISGIIDREGEGGTPQIHLADRLLIMLWYMASKDKYASIADRFGVSESTASYAIRTLLAFIADYLVNVLIVWPTNEELQEMQDVYRNVHQFPGVCGTIDGTHIEIEKPSVRGFDYYNRKDFYSIILQGVVAENSRFTDVFVGFPGKVHDARVFKNSPLFQTGQEVCGNGHILGDSAYPNLPWVIVPFRDNGHLTPVQKRFNQKHSAIRSGVERAFGLLKGRFLRLHYVYQKIPETIVHTILTGCVLHNLCILNDDQIDDLFIQVRPEPDVDVLANAYDFGANEQERAALKRLDIARRL